jgi:hypothetical protein
VIQFNTTAISGSPGGSTTTDDFIRFDNTNGVTIAKNLRLPTSGGTASALNYYEEHNFIASIKQGSTPASDFFASGSTVDIYVTRIGRIICINVRGKTAFTVNATDYALLTGLPSRFFATVQISQGFPFYYNIGATQFEGCLEIMNVANNNELRIYASNAEDNFTSATSVQFLDFSCTVTI